jgi:hypothetical protein
MSLRTIPAASNHPGSSPGASPRVLRKRDPDAPPLALSGHIGLPQPSDAGARRLANLKRSAAVARFTSDLEKLRLTTELVTPEAGPGAAAA